MPDDTDAIYPGFEQEYEYLECAACGWQGTEDELVCSDEDDKSDKPLEQIKFNRCPRCDSADVSLID